MRVTPKTRAEIDDALARFPSLKPARREPVIRIRTLFLAVFMTGLFSGLIIADPLARLIDDGSVSRVRVHNQGDYAYRRVDA